MDFSEIIVAIIIGLVILAINSLGAKKQQNTKNQPRRQPSRSLMSEESTPTENAEKEDEESWGIPRTLTLDEIFRELRKAREEADRQEPEEEEYIPRAPKRSHRPGANAPQPQPQSEWKLDTPSETTPAAKSHATPVVPSSPETEGSSVFTGTPAFAASRPVPTDSTIDAPVINVGEIDWRKAVIASEILNRKY